MNLLVILPPCTETGNCNASDFLLLFINLYKFGLEILAPVAILFFVIGGIVILTAAGYSERIERGKKILSQVIAGVFIVLLSWVIIDTSVFLLTGDENRTVFGTPWYEGFIYECDSGAEASPESPPSESSEGSCIIEPLVDDACTGPVLRDSCLNEQAMAESCNVPYPAQNAPVLDTLITCIRTHLPADMLDESQIYTFDRDHSSLNFTRGQRFCESCAQGACHGIYSCHYGGSSGTEGAMAVDFNANTAAGISEEALHQQLETIAKPGGGGPCAWLVQAGEFVFEETHTHIGAIGCGG